MRTFALAIATLVSVASIANAANCCDCSIPAKKPAKAVVTTKIGGIPKVSSCKSDGHYYRAQNDLFRKYGFMMVCDAGDGVGAVNLKAYDGTTGDSRPSSGPAYLGNCVVTAPGYTGKFAYTPSGKAGGCRVGLGDAKEVNGKIVFTISGVDYVSGMFGLKKAS